MNCFLCRSIWLRPAEPVWTGEGDASWTRRFQCGQCGAVFNIRATRIGQGPTDVEKKEMPAMSQQPKVILGNGGAGNGGDAPGGGTHK